MRLVRERRRKRMLAAIVLLGALALPGSARAETWVSFPALLQQVRSGDVIRAIINPARADIEIKFRNLAEWHAYYPRGEQRELQRLLAARHVRVLFVPRHPAAHAPRRAAVHHHLRYIAAGALVAFALAAGTVVFLRRRRSRRPREPRPREREPSRTE